MGAGWYGRRPRQLRANPQRAVSPRRIEAIAEGFLNAEDKRRQLADYQRELEETEALLRKAEALASRFDRSGQAAPQPTYQQQEYPNFLPLWNQIAEGLMGYGQSSGSDSQSYGSSQGYSGGGSQDCEECVRGN